MIRMFTGDELANEPLLARSMFLDRAQQFRNRLGWDVEVTDDGEERDEFDHTAAIYVIVSDSLGLHAGSMRLLPTTGPTMISEHFCNLVENIDFVSPAIWECTRFCISESRGAGAVALSLFQAGAEIMQQNRLIGFVGIFDPRMVRIYRRYGVQPEVLAKSKPKSGDEVCFGMWHNEADTREALLSQEPRSMERGNHSEKFPLAQVSHVQQDFRPSQMGY